MKKGIFTLLIFFSILLVSPMAVKADLIFEPEDEISSVYEENMDEPEEDPQNIPLLIGGLVFVVVIVTGILIWFFYGRKKKS